MREKDIENYLVQQAKAIGALVRKVSWVGLNHCPDRLIMLPRITVWVEVKAPGEKPRAGQQREHERMYEHGQTVYVVDSKESVDELIQILGRHL
jgi:hypothetical protein